MKAISPRTIDVKLRAMRALLRKPERWTQETMARNSHGTSVLPGDPEATCWCLMGANYRVSSSGDLTNTRVYEAVHTALWDAIGYGVVSFNDSPKQATRKRAGRS